MADLNHELRQLAEDGARQARPLDVADVIRRGGRRPGRRWPGWVAPLAAAAMVTAVVASAAVLSSAIHGSGPGHRPAAPTIYASYQALNGSDRVIVPINKATNRPGTPIHLGFNAASIAITPDGKTAYVAVMNKIIPISTATNKPGKPIRVPYGLPGWMVIMP